jgi:hypothetical protein
MVSGEKPLPESFAPGLQNSPPFGVDPAAMKNVKWVARLGGAAYGNPTVAGGRVFVGTDAQTLGQDRRSAAGGGGLVKCLDEATGRLLTDVPWGALGAADTDTDVQQLVLAVPDPAVELWQGRTG